MNKFTLAIIVVAAMMMSCGGKKTENAAGEVLVQSTEIIEQGVIDEHNAKNSLDYKGTYQGTLPTASGEGMDVTVVLGDSTYIHSISYVGKKTPAIVKEGKYTWNDGGTTVTLVGVDVPNQYFVGENVLFQLNVDGQRIEGDMANLYQLQKKN